MPAFAEETLRDRQWVERIQGGDDRAFETMFRVYYPRLCRFVCHYVKSLEIAEEIVQDIFLAIWENRERWNPVGRVRTYLYRAAKNRALNHLKHYRIENRFRRMRLVLKEESQSTPDEALQNKELLAAIEQGIEALPERCRLIFTMHRQEGLTYTEIAEILDISIKTVETQMGRALKSLRNRLQSFLPFSD